MVADQNSARATQHDPPLRLALTRLTQYTAGESAPGMLKASSNENPYRVPLFLRRAMHSSMRIINRYSPAVPETLQRMLAHRYNLAPSQVTIGNGSDELMLIVASATLEPDDVGIVPQHTFSIYRHVINLCGGVVQTAPMHNGTVKISDIVRCISAKTKMIFLCNPNNPTGCYLTKDEIIQLVDAIPSTVLVVLDQAYAEFVSATDYCYGEQLLDRYQNLVILRTFSKLYGLAGLRIGYALSSSYLAEMYNKIRMPFNLNHIAHAAARCVLQRSAYYTRIKEKIIKQRALLENAVQAYGYTIIPSQANFICLQQVKKSDELVRALRERRILVRALHSFGLSDCIRITVSQPTQNRKILTALREHMR